MEPADGGPIRPAAALERIDPASLRPRSPKTSSDAKALADFVVVAFHKGIVHTRARLAPYERPLAHAAVDAGCDVVIGHHAHIVRGIEFHRGVPIFHGLGNGCVVTRALSPDQASPERAAWARKRKELFGFEPDPAYVLAPFHPEAVNALLGRMRIESTGKVRVGFIPVHVDPPGRPRVAPEAAQRIADYIQTIGLEAGLPPLTMQITERGRVAELMERKSEGQTRGPLFYIGAGGLVLAMAVEALASARPSCRHSPARRDGDHPGLHSVNGLGGNAVGDAQQRPCDGDTPHDSREPACRRLLACLRQSAVRTCSSWA